MKIINQEDAKAESDKRSWRKGWKEKLELIKNGRQEKKVEEAEKQKAESENHSVLVENSLNNSVNNSHYNDSQINDKESCEPKGFSIDFNDFNISSFSNSVLDRGKDSLKSQGTSSVTNLSDLESKHRQLI